MIFAAFAVPGAAEMPALDSGDGLSLRLSDSGRVAAVFLDGKRLPPAPTPGGIFVRGAARGPAAQGARDGAARAGAAGGAEDVAAAEDAPGEAVQGAPFLAVAGKVTAAQKSLTVRGAALGDLRLEVDAEWTARDGHIALEGVVRDLSGAERCVDVKVSLPVACQGWRWGAGPEREVAVKGQAAGIRRGGSAVYPLAAVSDPALGAGLSLAVPPTHPTRIETGADEGGVYALFRVGISPLTRPAGRTPFRLILYRHDPAWGFRASLERYYAFFREPFFTRRVKKIGAWTWQNASDLINPDLYAYHEVGAKTWKVYQGADAKAFAQSVYSTGLRPGEGPVGTTVAEYATLSDLARNDRLGIYSLPYIIVGQRQIIGLPVLPPSHEAALAAFEKWTTDKPILFEGPPQALSFRSADQLKTIIRNSTIHDEQHRLDVVRREYRGPTLTFVQNPDPDLFADSGKPTVARYALDEYLPMLFAGSKSIDGCYVDSLGRWCGFYNYRREHFPYAGVPLTYAGDTPQVCLWNLQSHAEFLWELGRRLHKENKIVFANGVHPDRLMLGFAVDVLGMEGLPAYDNEELFYPRRVAAGDKPYTVLNARGHSNPRAWNSALYLGYLMGCNTREGAADERKYLPAIIRINEAGWEPVTHARATPDVVGVERWGAGGKGPLYLTVMNRSKGAVRAEVRVDRKALRLEGKAILTDLLSGKTLEARDEGEGLVLTLPLGPEQAAALLLSAR